MRRSSDGSTRREYEGLDGRYEVVQTVDLTLYAGDGSLGDTGHLVYFVMRGISS